MATLTVQSADKDGIIVTTATPSASGDQSVVSDDQRTAIIVFNGNASNPTTVTITAQRATAPQDGVGPDVAVSDITLAVAVGEIAVFPIPRAYIRTNDGTVQYSTSAQTDVEIAVIRLPRLTS